MDDLPDDPDVNSAAQSAPANAEPKPAEPAAEAPNAEPANAEDAEPKPAEPAAEAPKPEDDLEQPESEGDGPSPTYESSTDMSGAERGPTCPGIWLTMSAR
eukprot:15447157-Alexandrium_andersonii.AAC.1